MRRHAALLLALCAARARACYIQGQDSGVCTPAADLVLSGELAYCAKPISGKYESVCVPRTFGGQGFEFTTQKAFPWGFFPNHTIKAKDAWVQAYVEKAVARRLEVEAANGELDMRACGGAAARRVAAARARAVRAPRDGTLTPRTRAQSRGRACRRRSSYTLRRTPIARRPL